MTTDDRSSPILPGSMEYDPRATLNPGKLGRAEDLTVLQGDQVASLSHLVMWDLESGRQTGPRQPGTYRLNHKIGQGGQGEVWEAFQSSLQRVMALKRIRWEWLQSPQSTPERIQGFVENFRREALTMALLDHPGVLPIFDFWEDDEGHPILSMKRVQGHRWERELVVDYHALPYPDYLAKHLAILVQVTQTVAFAHSRGILHRDLKPSQVMLGQFGEVWLLDWGLAVAFQEGVEGPTPLALAPNPAGSPAYMAPEQTRPSPLKLGPATDVYLLGGLLYEILSGAPPHGLGSSSDAFLRAAKGLIDPLTEHRPARDWPEDLETLALEALQPAPADRLPSAQAFLERLQGHLSGRSRRQQAEVWFQSALALNPESSPRYGPISQALNLLNRALEAWPDHAQALATRNRVLERQVALALQKGDLGLAEASVYPITEPGTREALLAEVDSHKKDRARHQRSRKRALVASGLLTLALVGLGAKAYGDQRRAARTLLAQHQRAEALTAFMLDDLRGSLEPVGRLDLLKDVVQKVLAYYEALPTQERSQADRLLQAKALRQASDVLIHQNDTPQAAKAIAGAWAILEALPTSLTAGPYEKAMTLQVRAALAAREGRMVEARKDREAAAALLRGLLAQGPTEDLRMELVQVLLDLADATHHDGDHEQGKVLLAECHTQLNLVPPERKGHLKGRRLAFEVQLADAEAAHGRNETSKAEASYRAAAGEMVAILGQHDDYIEGRQQLANVHQRLGDLYSLTDRKALGMAEYRQALAWARAARALDPGRAAYQDKLGLLLNRVAQLHLNAHQAALGMPYLSESRDIYLHLAQVNPQDLEWISRLAYVEGLLGWGAREQKDFALSLRYFTQGVARTAALCARSPENTTYRTEWAVQLIEAGVAYNLVGQRIEATQVLEQALSLLEALRAKAPHPIQAELMAEAYVHLGRKEEARAKMLECLQAKFMTEEVRALAKTARIPLP